MSHNVKPGVRNCEEANIMCEICKYAAGDGFEECPRCGKKFYRCPMCSQPWAEEPRNLAKPNAQPALSDVRELLDAIYLTCDSYGHEDSRMKKTMSLYELRKVADRIKERVNFA